MGVSKGFRVDKNTGAGSDKKTGKESKKRQ